VNFTYNTTSPNEPRGNFGLDAAGNLYSTTAEGGPTASTSYGTIFKLSAGSYSNSQVAYFTSTTGIYPYGGVASDAAGNLYGTTQSGGGGQGSLFEVAANSGTVTKLVTFICNGTEQRLSTWRKNPCTGSKPGWTIWCRTILRRKSKLLQIMPLNWLNESQNWNSDSSN
jgi:uncharacterized repeat protein (TIGR03803 family)